DTERVIRGARDGFTESIVFNSALVRRRVRDKGLRNEMLHVGTRSKTDVCISYIVDIANPEYIKHLKKKIKQIDIDGLVMRSEENTSELQSRFDLVCRRLLVTKK